MSYETLGDFIAIADTSDAFHLFSERPTIRILFYTDYPYVTLAEKEEWGLFYLKNLVESYSPAFAKFFVDYQNRIPDPEVPSTVNKLDTLLATGNYDEVWLFGVYQVKIDGSYTLVHGGPDNELDENEVKALGEWMARGGILITGDHANPDPRKAADDPANNDHKTYLNLGRALGLKVPRAGKLRNWEGPPTRDKVDNYNTQVRTGNIDFEAPDLQEDPTPQKIELVADGPDGRPHPLFHGRKGWIEVFPDHMHEGHITLPDPSTMDKDEWPAKDGVRPEPYVVAYGRDKRPEFFNRCYSLVAVYDGDPVGVGRIVADSTWHHYFNVNLCGFVEDTSEGSVIDQLGQYYGNLALWLAPLNKRQAIKRAMFWWLSNHPAIKEETGSGEKRLGEVAAHLLSRHTTPCEAHELLRLAHEQIPDEQAIPFNLTAKDSRSSFLRYFQTLTLGSIVRKYQQAFSAIASADAFKAERTMSAEALIEEGLIKARDIYIRDLEQQVAFAQNSLQDLKAKRDSNNPEGGEENG